MADPTHDLRAAVERLYAAFAPYAVETLDGCPCCTSAEHGRYLASRPVRSLAPSDLGRYARKAMTTWGTGADFKHFLPRAFELAVADDLGWPEVEVVLGKLAYGGWRGWPGPERDAVGDHLRALWHDLLGRHPYPVDADAALCAIGQAEDDLGPYLIAWTADEGDAAALHLADFARENAGMLPNKPAARFRLANAFWTARPEQHDQVVRWICDPARRESLERAFFRASAPAGALREVSEAVEHLGRLATRVRAMEARG